MSNKLREITAQNKLAEWAGRISECRNSGQNVKAWCKENGVCEQTYYKWLKRLVTMARAQQEVQFAEVTPVRPVVCGSVAVTVRIAGADRVYIACGYTDLRRGIDGLAALVQQQFNLDPSPIHCSSSAADAGIGSRHYIRKVTDSSCCISGWNPALFNGPVRKVRPGH